MATAAMALPPSHAYPARRIVVDSQPRVTSGASYVVGSACRTSAAALPAERSLSSVAADNGRPAATVLNESHRLLATPSVGSRPPAEPNNAAREASSKSSYPRVSYHSSTHGQWINARVVAADPQKGAVQIDKKPGIWISAEDSRLRIGHGAAVQQAAMDKARVVTLPVPSVSVQSTEPLKEVSVPSTNGVSLKAAQETAASAQAVRFPAPRILGVNGIKQENASVLLREAEQEVSRHQPLQPRGAPDTTGGEAPKVIGGLADGHCPSTSSSPRKSSKEKPSPQRARIIVDTPAPEDPASPERTPQGKSWFKCPECGTMVESIEEAVVHCEATTSPTKGGSGQDAEAPENGLSGLPKGEPVAYDELGRPLIMRVKDPETSQNRTLVRQDTGAYRAFDDEDVDTLLNSVTDDVSKYLDGLSTTELRGLVHEVGQRLLENSQLYHSRLSELEKLGEQANFAFFGLDCDATERDLDNAYRKLAKKMHPDKNGGTEEAKKRFQGMKERYEALKKRLAGDCLQDSGAEEPEKENDEGDDAAANKETDQEKEKGDGKSIEYDPGDKDSMVQTVSKMAGQLKNIEIQMSVLMKELSRVKSQVP
ncbi:SCJ1 [Symbiodinium necroappetens]|uniref:SCJ1 protein n=1 Tax=Symbiodinium necroappetens TaxID=1628268 RepID=A0A812TRQ5_9DINO|nr:SCJ1 [Symbiodinium necroappetens]